MQSAQRVKTICLAWAAGLLLASGAAGKDARKPYRLSPDSYGDWNQSFPVEVEEVNQLNRVIGTKTVPIYLSGERRQARDARDKSFVTFVYSTAPLGKDVKERPLDIDTSRTRFYVVKPVGVAVTVEQGEKVLKNGEVVTSRLQSIQPFTLERVAFNAVRAGINLARQYDPVQAVSDSIDETGALGDKVSIYGLFNALAEKQESVFRSQAMQHFTGDVELQEIKLVSNDANARYPQVSKYVKLTVDATGYREDKIPIGVYQRISIGNASTQFQFASQIREAGSLEAIGEFTFDNVTSNLAATASSDILQHFFGKWEIIVPDLRRTETVYGSFTCTNNELILVLKGPPPRFGRDKNVLDTVTIRVVRRLSTTGEEIMEFMATENGRKEDSLIMKKLTDQQYATGLQDLEKQVRESSSTP